MYNFISTVEPQQSQVDQTNFFKSISGWASRDVMMPAPFPYDLINVNSNRLEESIQCCATDARATSLNTVAISAQTAADSVYMPRDQITSHVAHTTDMHNGRDAQSQFHKVLQQRFEVAELKKLQDQIERERFRIDRCHEMLALLKV